MENCGLILKKVVSMIGLLILPILSCFLFFIAYQSLKHHRTYWFAPTITGFGKRKKDTSPIGFSYFVGITSFMLGLWLLFLFVTGLFHKVG